MSATQAERGAEPSVVMPLEAMRQQRLDGQLRQLEFNAQLHRKLELSLLLECFLSEAQAFVAFDGLQYLAGNRGEDMLLGEPRPARQRFELKLGECSLGEVILLRSAEFSAREAREAERLIESLIYPLDNALLHFEAVMQSLLDSSTGLRNQRALDQQLPREIQLARRTGTPLSALLLNIDHFQAMENEHGTAVGQQAWRLIAESLTRHLRQSDQVFRTDRDRLFVLLDDADLHGALALAGRLLHRSDTTLAIGNVQLVVSASVGITELDIDDTPFELTHRVQRALDKAAQGTAPGGPGGRNRVCALPAVNPVGGEDAPHPDPDTVA